MAETFVAVETEIESTYKELKALLLAEKDCKITAEYAPDGLTVTQGSLWGITPKSAKKKVKFQLSQHEARTEIAPMSSLSSDYVKLTVGGCILAVVVALVCAWISLDLGAFAATRQPSIWSWLVVSNVNVTVQSALLLSDLTRVFAVFLAVTLTMEVVVVFYAKRGLGEFARQILKDLEEAKIN